MLDIFDKKLRVLNITHHDFDGAVSACVVSRYYDTVDIYSTGYNKDDKIVKYIELNKANIDAIVITDFFPKDKWEEIKAFGFPIVVLDHHESAEPFCDPKNRIYIKEGVCGAKMTYEYYVRKDPSLKNLEELVNIANDYDLWILNDLRSRAYNQLFWCSFTFKDFVYRYRSGDITLTKYDKEELLKWKTQVDNVWNSMEMTLLPCNGALATVSSNIADISYKLQQEGYSWYMLYNPARDAISLRSRTDKLDLVKLTAELGEGGGHKFAAGISGVAADRLEDITKRIVALVQKYNITDK